MVDVTPLYGLRLRTPRLTLRLPRNAELIELRELAHAGIHPPDRMPFGVAWTDEPYSKDFVVAFHREQLASWKAAAWNLNLGVWLKNKLIGSQTLHGIEFEKARTVKTGSWLGLAFQGQGYGTEMRVAALELAFRGLGAKAAQSGVLDGNIASRRVSEKLGYREASRGTLSPRGSPVGHTIYEVTDRDWRPPFAVTIRGLSGALPLFGLATTSADSP